MKPHRLSSRPFLPARCLALLLPLAACAATPPAPSGSARIDALIGDARCSTDADCRTSPIGQQACGGPAGFIAWSVQRTSADKLQAALDQHLAEQRVDAHKQSRVSTCRVKVDPGAYCRAAGTATAVTASATAPGRCTLRPAGSLPTR